MYIHSLKPGHESTLCCLITCMSHCFVHSVCTWVYTGQHSPSPYLPLLIFTLLQSCVTLFTLIDLYALAELCENLQPDLKHKNKQSGNDNPKYRILTGEIVMILKEKKRKRCGRCQGSKADDCGAGADNACES